MDFPSAGARASGGDLAVQISPLGMVELSEEEFEIHGPRMIRYANAAAFYLGHQLRSGCIEKLPVSHSSYSITRAPLATF